MQPDLVKEKKRGKRGSEVWGLPSIHVTKRQMGEDQTISQVGSGKKRRYRGLGRWIGQKWPLETDRQWNKEWTKMVGGSEVLLFPSR